MTPQHLKVETLETVSASKVCILKSSTYTHTHSTHTLTAECLKYKHTLFQAAIKQALAATR